MGSYVPWEKLPTTTPAVLEEFVASYKDLSLTVDLIGATFNISGTTVTSVAKRLGLPLRHPRKSHPTDPIEGSTLQKLEQQETALKEQLKDVQKRKHDLEVRVTRHESVLTIFGLAEPITVSVRDAVYWLRGQGPAKLREKIRDEEFHHE